MTISDNIKMPKEWRHTDGTVCKRLNKHASGPQHYKGRIFCERHSKFAEWVEADAPHGVPQSQIELWTNTEWWITRNQGWKKIADLDDEHLGNCIGLMNDHPEYFTTEIKREIIAAVQQAAIDRDFDFAYQLLEASSNLHWIKNNTRYYMHNTPLYKAFIAEVERRRQNLQGQQTVNDRSFLSPKGGADYYG